MSDYSQVISGELHAAGVAFTVCNGGKHKLAEWTGASGRRRKVQIDITPSDHRSAENAKHDLRRILREDGDLVEACEVPPLTVSGGQAFASSRQVAERFGKAHKDVLRAYDQVAADAGPEFTERNFAPSSYKDGSGRTLRCIDMTRDGFSMLAMGFTGKSAMAWKVAYITAFNRMEAELAPRGNDELQARVERLEGDLKVAVDILFEFTTAPTQLPSPQTVVVRKAPFVRPSVLRAQRKAGRA